MDLCGEPLFLEKIQLKYDTLARKKNVSIVGSCGFDSIPSDIGTSYLKNKFDGTLGQVEHYLQIWSSNKNYNYATWRALIEGYKCRDQLKDLRKEIFAQFYKPYQWPVPLSKFGRASDQF